MKLIKNKYACGYWSRWVRFECEKFCKSRKSDLWITEKWFFLKENLKVIGDVDVKLFRVEFSWSGMLLWDEKIIKLLRRMSWASSER